MNKISLQKGDTQLYNCVHVHPCVTLHLSVLPSEGVGCTGTFLVSHASALPASSRRCCLLPCSWPDAVAAACQTLLADSWAALEEGKPPSAYPVSENIWGKIFSVVCLMKFSLKTEVHCLFPFSHKSGAGVSFELLKCLQQCP